MHCSAPRHALLRAPTCAASLPTCAASRPTCIAPRPDMHCFAPDMHCSAPRQALLRAPTSTAPLPTCATPHPLFCSRPRALPRPRAPKPHLVLACPLTLPCAPTLPLPGSRASAPAPLRIRSRSPTLHLSSMPQLRMAIYLRMAIPPTLPPLSPLCTRFKNFRRNLRLREVFLSMLTSANWVQI